MNNLTSNMQKIIIRCIDCKKEFLDWDVIKCSCGSILEVIHNLKGFNGKSLVRQFENRLSAKSKPYNSGVWRYKELVLPIDDKDIVTMPEGNTNIYNSKRVSNYVGIEFLYLKSEAQNPTASFKDRGMTTAISVAKYLGYNRSACASTGNTSASMSAYSAIAGMQAIIFIPERNVALGKLAQTLAYGARTIQVKGNFDSAMNIVQLVCEKFKIYPLNSINPFRIEGQKTIAYETLQQLNWNPPDWFVLPGGNLGNSSAIGKGLKELYELGAIKKIPRIAIIQAHGANPFYKSFKEGFKNIEAIRNPKSIATAIRIGKPVSWKKAVGVIKYTNGVVEEVSEQEIIDAKIEIDSAGIGCEPASAVSVAGIKKLVENGVIKNNERVVAILTGNILKDIEIIINYNEGKLAGIKSKCPNLPVKVNGVDDVIRILNESIL